jgi:hypothetical protein
MISYLIFLGSNPVIIAVNKSDLLPNGASYERVLKWIHSALKEKHIRNVISVHLISSSSGKGNILIILVLSISENISNNSNNINVLIKYRNKRISERYGIS